MIKKPISDKSVTISPSFKLPIILIFLSFMLLFLKIGIWPTIISSSFSIFLLLQSFTLRIKITQEDFIVLQFGKEIRVFPFKNWISWKFFFDQLPIIFYFREKSSPHLLPFLFSPSQLKDELLKRVQSLEIKPNESSSKQ